MGSRKLTAEDLEQITKLAKNWGKIVVRQAFGDDGPGLDVDLSQMEDVAVAAARGLTAGALEEATSQQGRLLGRRAGLSSMWSSLWRHFAGAVCGGARRHL